MPFSVTKGRGKGSADVHTHAPNPHPHPRPCLGRKADRPTGGSMKGRERRMSERDENNKRFARERDEGNEVKSKSG